MTLCYIVVQELSSLSVCIRCVTYMYNFMLRKCNSTHCYSNIFTCIYTLYILYIHYSKYIILLKVHNMIISYVNAPTCTQAQV